MAKIFEEWTVLKHKPIEKLTENIWTVVGEVPKMSLKRRMTLIRLEDGKLIIHSPIALKEDEMREVEQWGEIAFIVVPNSWHRLDSKVFKKRFPDAKIVCPRGSRKKVEEVVSVDLTYDEVPRFKDVSFTHIEGIKEVEGVLEVCSEKGVILIFNDLIFNLPNQSGIGGFFFRMMGSTGGPKVTRIMKFFVVKNKKELRDHLSKLTEKHENIYCIIPGHGYIIDQECNQVLKNIAIAL